MEARPGRATKLSQNASVEAADSTPGTFRDAKIGTGCSETDSPFCIPRTHPSFPAYPLPEIQIFWSHRQGSHIQGCNPRGNDPSDICNTRHLGVYSETFIYWLFSLFGSRSTLARGRSCENKSIRRHRCLNPAGRRSRGVQSGPAAAAGRCRHAGPAGADHDRCRNAGSAVRRVRNHD